jgi:hypothetical protein
VCRARDLTGNEDKNTFARVATTAVDSKPPTFGGATGVRSVQPTSVQLYWDTPASDDQTPVAQIVYVAYQATTMGGEIVGDAGTPVATSDPGATSMTITGLQPATQYYWIVRAQDRAGNTETNKAEVSATTQVSFSQNIVVILGTHCAVVGCHVPGSPPNGLIMTPNQAYSNLVGVSAVEEPAYLRVDPGNASDSLIYLKTSAYSTGVAPPGGYLPMPPPVTMDQLSAAELQVLVDWINQGALQN